MKSERTRTSLVTMSVTEMFSLWWKERWVRGLVFALSPIGLVDALFTFLLFQAHGPEFEYNPIVKLALTSDWWFVWIIVDIVSFVFFAMIAGSYYVHTRRSIFGNQVGWLSLLVSVRVGAVVYNIFSFYLDPYPIFWATLGTIITYFMVNKLLSRESDISVAGFKRYWRAKYDRIHDRLITRGLKREEKEEEDVEESVPEIEPITSSKLVMLKRAGYLSMVIMVFVSTPFVLIAVGNLTGGLAWNDLFGDSFYWNTVASQSFIAGFVTIIILISLMMYFMLKAFTTSEGAW
ncbi:MAG: hypothetical protein AM325_005150 [Candidatus Thorarchaeota archaeon SMTZ1-45]